MKQIQTSRDALLKGAIEDFFEDFLGFFFAKYLHIFDLSKGFVFMDKELIEIRPKSKGNQRYADKLVKLFTYDGKEEWILIHIEVQGYDDPAFPERMFIYYYRILDRFQKRITALAIFTDDESTHPTQYHSSFMDTELTYKFNTYKLKDKTAADFEDTDNPFAVIMEVAWQALKQQQLDDTELFNFKIRLVRKLKSLNYETEKIRKLFNFIKRYVNFENPEINLKFENQANIIFENQQIMGIEEAIIQDSIEQGIERGIEIGEKKGVEKTEKKYEAYHKLSILKLQEKGFSDEEIAEILNISVEEILRLTK